MGVGIGERAWVRGVRRRAALDGALTIFVEVDGAAVGALLLDDPIRPDATRTIRQLRREGIRRIVMVTGDREDNAQTVGAVIGVDDVLAERTPAEKVEAVRLEKRAGRRSWSATASTTPRRWRSPTWRRPRRRGATASSEAADVVLTVDRLDRLGEAIVIARRARLITSRASSSVSACRSPRCSSPRSATAARMGRDPPRSHRRRRHPQRPPRAPRYDVGEPAHRRRSRDRAPVQRRAHDAPPRTSHASARSPTRSTRRGRPSPWPWCQSHFLVDELAPHEEAEDATLYPALAAVLGGRDPTATMSRAHVEIAHLIRRIGRVLDDVDPAGPDDDDVTELRRLLYGLHAVLQLHFAQEDEGYLSLADDTQPPSPPPEERQNVTHTPASHLDQATLGCGRCETRRPGLFGGGSGLVRRTGCVE